MLLKDKNIPFRKIVYLQTWLFCKMYLNTVYEIRGQKISASTKYTLRDGRIATSLLPA